MAMRPHSTVVWCTIFDSDNASIVRLPVKECHNVFKTSYNAEQNLTQRIKICANNQYLSLLIDFG
jgi:hypothetical protein